MFLVFPTKEEQKRRLKKFPIESYQFQAQQQIRMISAQYFTQEVAKKLSDPSTSTQQLETLFKKSPSHMQNLTDMVSYCFIQSIASLSSRARSLVLLQALAQQKYPFNDAQMSVLMYTVVSLQTNDMAKINIGASIVSVFCMNSYVCLPQLLEMIQRNTKQMKVPLSAIHILLKAGKLTDSDKYYIKMIPKFNVQGDKILESIWNGLFSEFPALQPPWGTSATTVKKPTVSYEKTPLGTKINSLKTDREIDRCFQKIQLNSLTAFIIITVILFIVVILASPYFELD